MHGPRGVVGLGALYFLRVLPAVSRELGPIASRAGAIKDPLSRALALDALRRKRFHCEGGAMLAAGDALLTRITVLYQTLCDYLDTLTDRGPRMGAQEIARLHLCTMDALCPGAPLRVQATGHDHDGGYREWL
ncbi:hypothetical protein B1A_18341, partial [mine drainage metagenome]